MTRAEFVNRILEACSPDAPEPFAAEAGLLAFQLYDPALEADDRQQLVRFNFLCRVRAQLLYDLADRLSGREKERDG